MKNLTLALLLTAGSAGSLGAQSITPNADAGALAQRIAGCYRLDDGPWRADSVHAGDISTKNTPLAFVLTDQLLPGWESLQTSAQPLYAVHAFSGGKPPFPFIYWQRLSPSSDSIRVSYPMPLAGVALTLTPDGRDLAGTVTAFTDAIEENKPSSVSRAVRARRVACP